MLSVNAVAGSASVHWLGIEDYTDLKGGDGVKEDQYANEFFTLIEKEIKNISTSVTKSAIRFHCIHKPRRIKYSFHGFNIPSMGLTFLPWV